jgi:hypothetical protein
MKKDFTTGLTVNIDTAQLKSKKMDGKQYLVGPIVMATEGVMNGLLYTADELKKSVPRWNGRPVTNGHPKDAEGKFITANTPETLEANQIGFLFHVNWDAKASKLRGECWLEKSKLSKFPEVNAKVNKSEMMEVSTGLFIERTGDSGIFNNEEYTNEATNHAPDHMALLPNEIGACSVEDGAGFPRANQQMTITGGGKQSGFLVSDGTAHYFPTKVDGTLNVNLMTTAWYTLHEGYKGHRYSGAGRTQAIATLTEQFKELNLPIPVDNSETDEHPDCIFPETNAIGYSTVGAILNRALKKKMDKKGSSYCYTVEHNDSDVFFEMYNSAVGVYDLFRINYKYDEKTNVVTFVGDPVAVVRKVAYEDAPDVNEQGKGKQNMARKEEVDALITGNRFEEGQRAWLMGLPDDQFMAVHKACTPAAIPTPAPQAPAPAPEMNAEMKEALGVVQKMKEEAVAGLIAVNADAFTREELSGMSLTQLKKLTALAATPAAGTVDRAGLGGPGGSTPAVNADTQMEAPLLSHIPQVEKKA